MHSVDGSRPEWRIDRGLVDDLAALVGWDPGDGVAALVAALAAVLPAGSTSKLDAMHRHEIPPGADPDLLARQILDEAAVGSPRFAWSCWVYATLFAALLETSGVARADIVAARRCDDAAPLVDLHAAVVVNEEASEGDGGRRWLCDPFFLAVIPGPGSVGTEAVHQGAWGARTDEADGSWSYEVGTGRWAKRLAYRRFSVPLGRDDIRALCAISVTHSGVPPVPSARLWWADRIVQVSVRDPDPRGAGTSAPSPAGPWPGARIQTWRWTAPPDAWAGHDEEQEYPSWDEAVAAFGDRTGVTLHR